VPTTVALAPVSPTRGHRSRLATAGERAGLGPVAVEGLRDAFSRPARALLTALALAVAVVAVVVTSGFNRTIDGVFADPAMTGEPEEVRIFPAETAAPDTVPTALASTAGVASWFTETGFNAALGSEQVLANAMGGDVAHAGFVVREGRMIQGRGEAVTGYGFLQRFGLEVGDRFTIEVDGHPVRLRIVGWYSETEEAGEMLMFPYADVTALDPTARPASYRLRLDQGADRTEVAASLASALGAQARVEPVSEADPAELDPFRFAVDLISGLVILVALANLASTLVLVVRERSRDLAVLRAVGFTPRQTIAVVAIGGAALAIVATALGLPAGWLLSNAVNNGVGAGIGMGPGIAVSPSVALVVLVAPLALAVTAGLAALAARRAATEDVAVLVRYE
jgi:putative ABC transport system permease protein